MGWGEEDITEKKKKKGLFGARITSFWAKTSVQRVSGAQNKKGQAGFQPNKISAKDILGRSIFKKRKPSANNTVVSVSFHWVTKNV